MKMFEYIRDVVDNVVCPFISPYASMEQLGADVRFSYSEMDSGVKTLFTDPMNKLPI